jgi:Flp pilus assembly protein TadB
MIGVSALSAIGLACITRIGLIPCLLVGLLIGMALHHMIVGRMGRRRVAAFVSLFPEAIDLMVRARARVCRSAKR